MQNYLQTQFDNKFSKLLLKLGNTLLEDQHMFTFGRF